MRFLSLQDSFNEILEYLDVKSILSLSFTSRRFRCRVRSFCFNYFKYRFKVANMPKIPLFDALRAIETANTIETIVDADRVDFIVFCCALDMTSYISRVEKYLIVNSVNSCHSRCKLTPLTVCIQNNNKQTLDYLLQESNANIDVTDSSKLRRTPLMHCLITGNFVTEILSHNPNLNLKDGAGKTVFDYLDESQYLLAEKILQYAKSNSKSADLLSSLRARLRKAILRGENRLAEALIDALPQALNPEEEGQDSELIISIRKKHASYAIKLLVAKFPVLVIFPSVSGKPPLYIAAEEGLSSVTEYLLLNGASLKQLTLSGRNALHVAIEQGNQRVCQILCKFSDLSDITLRCNNGLSPFMLAENRGRCRLLAVMLSRYAQLRKDSRHPYLEDMLYSENVRINKR
jgi:ankyrin repeat protein